MFLSNVRIRNFRNLRDFTVSFSAGLNVIVGENNIGKTNLLDAIRLALGYASTSDPIRVAREDRHRLPDGSYVNEPIQISLSFAGLTEDERAEFIDILKFDATNPALSTAEIDYEWSWPDAAKRWNVRRVGGGRTVSEGNLPEDVLQAIPVTMLGALRDALVALSPGRNNRLGQLLRASASKGQQQGLEQIIKAANAALEADPLIAGVETQIAKALLGATGPKLGQTALIRASEPSFERIVSNLRLVLKERGLSPTSDPVLSELRSNGLGYNNLLYVATVLAELGAATDATLPLLLVEEPEAHLHPQLQTLLADFLVQGGTTAEHRTRVQTIVTTHSPTLAAHVPPKMLNVVHRSANGHPRCVSIASCGLTDAELKQLRRMLDVTKATLLFARGVVLVEGITEALLLPALATRLGLKVHEAGVAIVPLAGVDFESIAKLFGERKIGFPVSIITDADPDVLKNEDGSESPRVDGAAFHVSHRVAGLKAKFETNPHVGVFTSDVTLEYDLAAAGVSNADVLFQAWTSCYERRPRKLTKEHLTAASTPSAKALLLWRVLCRGEPAHGKAALAQALAALLEDRDEEDRPTVSNFVVPTYIESALRHALGSSSPPEPIEPLT